MTPSGTATAIVWDNATGSGDWARTPGNTLAVAGSLEASVWISLFTDRRARPDDVLSDGSDDRRGWWADAFATRPIGSRLWLLRRAKRLPDTLRRAETYAREALAWLVEDGVAARVDVAAEWADRSFLVLRPVIIHRDGRRSALAYDWAWGGL